MSSLPADPYKALGVSKDAQIPEIRSAHRKLVLKCHPDKVQDPELKAQKQDEFQKVQQAYELLSDEKERQKYDDQVKLAELRKAFQNKANISSPRASPKYADFEVYTAEPRPSTFKTSSSQAPQGAKMYFTTTTRSYDDDRSPNVTEIRTSRRGTTTYSEKPSKREAERERERDHREREEKRDRERRRRADEDARREEKMAKEARRAEKKKLEKQRDKEIKEMKRMADDKRRPNPYIEPFEDELQAPKEKKKSSSSRKYDGKRERSSHRDEVHAMPHAMHPPPVPSMPSMSTMPASHDRAAQNLDTAASYINRARQPGPGLTRSATDHAIRHMAPPAPTPPPAQGSPFAAPTVADDSDEPVHRSSAKARRGSSDTVKSARTHKKSREFEEPPHIVDASPTPRPLPTFEKATSSIPMSSSPRQNLPRTNSMPVDHSYSRPAGPGVARSATFNTYTDSASPRGRGRSNLQSQIYEEAEDSEEEYEQEREHERRRQERKHRSGKKTRSPEPHHRSGTTRYAYAVGGDNRTKLQQNAYSRPLEQPDDYYYDRPPMPSRDAYSSSGAAFPKVKQSKAYGYSDAAYSDYHHQSYREDYPAAYA